MFSLERNPHFSHYYRIRYCCSTWHDSSLSLSKTFPLSQYKKVSKPHETYKITSETSSLWLSVLIIRSYTSVSNVRMTCSKKETFTGVIARFLTNISWLLCCGLWGNQIHYYSDVIMGAMASQITSFTIVYSTVYSGADQRKYGSSASLVFVRGIHRWPVNSPH